MAISHISFTVEDVQAFANSLEGHGVSLAGEIGDFTNDQGVIRTIFVYDPNGILVQFDEGPAG